MNVEKKTLEAQEIILKDVNGTVQGSLKAGDHGPTLSLLDGQGHTRLQLSVFMNDPVLRLFNERGKPVVGILVVGEAAHVHMTDARTDDRVDLRATGEGGQLLLTDIHGKSVCIKP